MTSEELKRLARAHLDGRASDASIAMLQEHRDDWVFALQLLLRDADAALDRVRANVSGPERDLVIADFTDERRQIDAALNSLTGGGPDREPDAPEEAPDRPVPTGLQLSWTPGRLVAWAPGAGAAGAEADGAQSDGAQGDGTQGDGAQGDGEAVEALRTRLRETAAATHAWTTHSPVALPDGTAAAALQAPVQSALGWLVGLATSADGDSLGTSARWLALVAGLAVRLAAQGRMVPQLDIPSSDEGGSDGQGPAKQGSGKQGSGKQGSRKQGRGKGGQGPGRQGHGRSTLAVRWAPALIDEDELGALAGSLPGSVAALHTEQRDARAFTTAVVGDLLDAICRDAAARIEVPAPPPDPRSEEELAETVLARLDGTDFEGPQQRGTDLRRGLQQWARTVTSAGSPRLVVQLDPPDQGDAWHLRTLTAAGGKRLRVDAAMSNASHSRREAIKRELDRLEVLFPALLRGKSTRRGEVVLSQDEAWELMTATGAVLLAAGFEVRVPPLSTRRPAPGLRLTSLQPQGSTVGAQQLTTVAWSAVFDDVELTAADIARLAAEARPLVKTGGRWVALDHADLAAAAAALAERADSTRLTGADMLRHALGLDGSPLPGGITVAGDGWAADLLRSAGQITERLQTHPEGFSGELRSYQAEALAWLEFLDGAGLGGCLALDMGLGKTPTMLAHLRTTTGRGPALVVAPPAVVGNWAAESRRFVPELRVVVHHGSGRAGESDIAAEVADADLVITTYGTAVRDIAALEDVAWSTLVLDEAQVIKNPASDTAQQLRRLEARSRVALTGTPIENGLGDLWALLDFTNPGLVGDRSTFVSQLSRSGESRSNAEQALRTLNGVLVFRRTKAEPLIAAELPDRIDVLEHCPMTEEQIGLYQAVLDNLVAKSADDDGPKSKGAVLAAITALKQICNHPAAYTDGDDGELAGRSGKLARCEEIVDNAFAAGERVLIFTHFASWGNRLAVHLSKRTGMHIASYHGGLSRGARDRMVKEFQQGQGAGALVLSLKAGGTGLNLTAASQVVLYDRWWNPAVEDQARDRAWRIGQTKVVVCHRLVCPGTVDERVEEVVAGKRRIADLVLPASSSVDDLRSDQLRAALGIDRDAVLTDDTMQPEHQEAAA